MTRFDRLSLLFFLHQDESSKKLLEPENQERNLAVKKQQSVLYMRIHTMYGVAKIFMYLAKRTLSNMDS